MGNSSRGGVELREMGAGEAEGAGSGGKEGLEGVIG